MVFIQLQKIYCFVFLLLNFSQSFILNRLNVQPLTCKKKKLPPPQKKPLPSVQKKSLQYHQVD